MAKKKSGFLKWVGMAGLAGAVFVPGLDLLAGPALIALLVSMAGGPKGRK